MKIVCVSGGSYKSCYLNCLSRIRQVDLLVFNYGIIYNYEVMEKENFMDVVYNELMDLSKSLNAVVVASVCLVSNDKKSKALIIADNNHFFISNAKHSIGIKLKNKLFFIGNDNSQFLSGNRIVLSNKRIKPNIINCAKGKTYIFCDNYGCTIVKNKNLSRKFSKYSKIILK